MIRWLLIPLDCFNEEELEYLKTEFRWNIGAQVLSKRALCVPNKDTSDWSGSAVTDSLPTGNPEDQVVPLHLILEHGVQKLFDMYNEVI